MSGVWLGKLNKITGWKSRTVPPLCMLLLPLFGESQSLGSSREGERECGSRLIRKA